MTGKAVIARLDELLKPLGFTRLKSTWNRRAGCVVDVIDVQVSKAGDTVTLNAGVLDQEVHARLWGGEPPSFVEEPTCTVRARVGELIGGTDRWWPLDVPGTATDVAHAVDSHVLPFVESMHSRGAMVEWLETTKVVKKRYPPPIINLAILKNSLGQGVEACELLADLKKEAVGAWQSRVADVARRLECE